MTARRSTLAIVFIASAVLLAAGAQQNAAQLYQSGVYAEEIEGNLQKAIGIYERVLEQFPNNLEMAANAQLHIGLCYERMGVERARDAYEKVVKNYPGQAAVRVAQAKLDNILRAAAAAEKGPAELTIRQVQTPPMWEGQGGISPNGKLLADIDARTGDLWVRELASGKDRGLTTEGKDYSQFAFTPQWSPDSAKLAFGWYGADRVGELRVIALDGSPAKVLARANTAEGMAPLAWSPDGKQLLVAGVGMGSPTVLSLVSVADGSTRTLRTLNDRRIAGALFAFSPDGLAIAYSRQPAEDAPERDIFLLAADGSDETPLLQHQADDALLAWLPEGRGILFASDRAGTIDLWAVQIDKGRATGAPMLIKRSIGPITPMGLTAAGAFYYRTPGAFMDVFTAALDPKTGTVIGPPKKEPLPYEGQNQMPEWSPDGKRLAYFSRRPRANPVLSIYSAETGKVREYRFTKYFAYPHWAPDGRAVYAQTSGADGNGIYRLDVETGEAKPFVGAGGSDMVDCLQVSPDQKWIVYGRCGKEGCRILRRNAASGEETEIDRGPIANSTLMLAPDGTRLAIMLRTDAKTRVLKVATFPDGAPKELVRFTFSGSHIIDLTWSPDGRFVYYSENPTGTRGDWHLKRIAADGGAPQDLGLAMRYFMQLSAHPDGSRITFATGPPNAEPSQAWVMENFLPRK